MGLTPRLDAMTALYAPLCAAITAYAPLVRSEVATDGSVFFISCTAGTEEVIVVTEGEDSLLLPGDGGAAGWEDRFSVVNPASTWQCDSVDRDGLPAAVAEGLERADEDSV